MSDNLVFIIFLWIVFGFQHSFLAQKRFKDVLGDYVGQLFVNYVYRFLYFLSQCIVFPIFWYFITEVEADYVIWSLPEAYYPLFYLAKILSHALLLVSVLSIDVNYFIGLKQFLRFLHAKIHRYNLPNQYEQKGVLLNTRYLYRLVRHPMYLGILLSLITSTVHYTDKYLLNLFCLFLYIEIGIFFEEKQLIREFKDSYGAYQKLVPKLIPFCRLF